MTPVLHDEAETDRTQRRPVRSRIPGPRLQIATLPRFFVGWASLQQSCRERYGDIFRIRYPGLGSVVMVADPDAVRTLFRDSESTVTGPTRARVNVEDLVNPDVVAFLDGAAHARRRRLLLPHVYAGRHLADYERVMAEIVGAHTATWHRGDEFRIRDMAVQFTSEMVARVVLGISDPAGLARCRASLPRLMPAWGMTRLLPARVKSDRYPGPWRRYTRMRNEMRRLVDDQIRRATADSGRNDICARLRTSEHAAELPDEIMRDELLGIALTATHSLSVAISWMFDLVLHDAATLERLETDPSDTEFCDAVVAEVLRLRALADLVPRVLTRDMELCGVRVRAGETVAPSTYLLHRDPNLFDRPDEFDPGRFVGKRPPIYGWIPFGGGPHRCMGAPLTQLEMRVVMQEVFTRWRLRAVRPQPSKQRRVAFFWTPVGGVKVRVEQARRPAGSE
jgi:cytochrome P450 family 135